MTTPSRRLWRALRAAFGGHATRAILWLKRGKLALRPRRAGRLNTTSWGQLAMGLAGAVFFGISLSALILAGHRTESPPPRPAPGPAKVFSLPVAEKPIPVPVRVRVATTSPRRPADTREIAPLSERSPKVDRSKNADTVADAAAGTGIVAVRPVMDFGAAENAAGRPRDFLPTPPEPAAGEQATAGRPTENKPLFEPPPAESAPAATLGSEVMDARTTGAAEVVPISASLAAAAPTAGEFGPPPPPADGGATPKQAPKRLAALPVPAGAQWLKNAVAAPEAGDTAVIAIVIDDVGIDQNRTRRAIALPGPLTLSFIPYGYNLRKHVAAARAAGHEILVHIPMEPVSSKADPGPNALLTRLEEAENLRRLRWGLGRFDGYVGVSNHMGSKFTAWPAGMAVVLREVRARGLVFLDSWTNNRSLGLSLSVDFGIPSVARDIFIDHDVNAAAIRGSLAKLERIARRRGHAIGIGHPHDLTVAILRDWIAGARARGFQLVPVTAIVRRRKGSG